MFGLRKNPFKEPRWDIASRATISSAVIKSPSTLPPMPTSQDPAERNCVHCGAPLYASPRTLSARCTSCGKHVSLQNLTLKGDVEAERTITAGTITVTHDAKVSGDLIASRVVVEGRVLGNIVATRDCVITATGKVAGQIICRNISVAPGAELLGAIERITAQPLAN